MGAHAFTVWYNDLKAWEALAGPEVSYPFNYSKAYRGGLVTWAIYNHPGVVHG